MKTYKRIYFGKGKKVKGLEIVKCTVNLHMIQDWIYEEGSQMHLDFEIAEMKKPDQYGNTHTIFVTEVKVTES